MVANYLRTSVDNDAIEEESEDQEHVKMKLTFRVSSKAWETELEDYFGLS